MLPNESSYFGLRTSTHRTESSQMAMNKKALQSAIALAGVSAFALTACTGPTGGGTSSGSAAGGGSITYGTTDKVVTLDPAGSYDAGSFMVMNQIYPFLMNSKPGTADSSPDIAESASFTSPTEYTVKLKSGLKFANGHALTSSDVKFSIDRVIKIATTTARPPCWATSPRWKSKTTPPWSSSSRKATTRSSRACSPRTQVRSSTKRSSPPTS